jgi:hypothetical protein
MSCSAITLSCLYCGHPLDEVRDTWIGHGQMAHSACGWAAEEAFFFFYDLAQSEREASNEDGI